jgi:hypothetical protein
MGASDVMDYEWFSPRLSYCYPELGDNENIRRYCTNNIVDINSVWKNAVAPSGRGFAYFSTDFA